MLVCKRPLCVLFFAVLAVLSVFFHISGRDDAGSYAYPDKQELTFTGTVRFKEQKKADDGSCETVFVLRAEEAVRRDGSVVKTSVTMQVYPEPASPVPVTGERIRVRGTVRCFAEATNPGEFDARRYYAIRGIDFRLAGATVEAGSGTGSVFREGLYRLRLRLGSVLDACMTEEDAGVMKAMLLGDRASLDDDTKALYKRAGISHLLAVSGLHFALFGGCLFRILKALRLPRKLSALSAVACMFAYGLLCGMPTSAIRSIAMFALAQLAPQVCRTYDMLSAMSLAGMLAIAEMPRYATDTAFLLSYGAIAGLGILYPALGQAAEDMREVCLAFWGRFCTAKRQGRRLTDAGSDGMRKRVPDAGRAGAERKRVPDEDRAGVLRKGIRNGLLGSLSVILATLPVQLCAYGTFSVWSLLINLLVIPLMGLVMPAGFVVFLPGLFSQAAGSVAALPNHALLSVYRWICEQNSLLPFHTWYAGCPAAWQVALYYLLLVLFCMYGSRGDLGRSRKRKEEQNNASVRSSKRKEEQKSSLEMYPDRKRRLFEKHLMIAPMLVPLALAVLAFRVPPALQIAFLDVGQGDGIVVRSGTHSYLIDCGSSSKRDVGTYQLIPYLKHEGIGSLDAVFVSHEDEDHVSGVFELFEDMEKGGIRVGRLFLPDTGREEAIMALCEAGMSLQNAGSVQESATTVQSGTVAEKTNAGQMTTTDDRYLGLAFAAYRLGVPVTYLSNGQQGTQGDLVFTCLAPDVGAAVAGEEANAHSMVLHLQYVSQGTGMFAGFAEGQFSEAAGAAEGRSSSEVLSAAKEQTASEVAGAAGSFFSALFTGDIEGTGLDALNRTLTELPEEMRTLDVLKVAHHGSRFNTDETFLSLIDARLAVISCGRNNVYGHPHAETLDRLAADGAQIAATPDCGAITVTVSRDGDDTSFRTESFLHPQSMPAE